MSIIVGLTGSICAGKSTVASILRDKGAEVCPIAAYGNHITGDAYEFYAILGN